MSDPSQLRQRNASIDIARGVIMVIMALDHVRDFVHKDAQIFSPTDLSKTNYALFFTRWVTHFCAPTFVFLAGASIAISATRKTKSQLTRFLLTRGFWLVVLDLTVMRFVLLFNFYYDVTLLSVLWMIGLCMMCMAALIHLPQRLILITGLLILFLHNSLDEVSVAPGNWYYAPWLISMRVGFIPINEAHGVITSYSLVPWLSVMMLGYSFGWLYQPGFDAAKRRKWMVQVGGASIATFMILRSINLYGDPLPWTVQQDKWMTILSFLNVTKYPVSLQFILITIGPLLIFLSFLENERRNAWKPFMIVGRVPLFYFGAHFFLAHTIALLMVWLNGTSPSQIDFHFSKSFGGIAPGIGSSLVVVYLVWILVVVAMYPFCKTYDRYKSTHNYRWLSYL